MNQPLGKFVGNALEVFECVKILRGEIEGAMRPTLELSIELAARMLVLCGVEETVQSSKSKVQSVLDSGAALEKFRQNVELQNGNTKVCDNPEILLDKNLIRVEVKTEKTGFINDVDAGAIGESVSKIGGGRNKVEDAIDFAVGYQCEKTIGDEIRRGDALGVLYCRRENRPDSIREKLARAYKIRPQRNSNESRLIKEIIGS